MSNSMIGEMLIKKTHLTIVWLAIRNKMEKQPLVRIWRNQNMYILMMVTADCPLGRIQNHPGNKPLGLFVFKPIPISNLVLSLGICNLINFQLWH